MCEKVFYYIIVYSHVKKLYAISLEHSCMCVFVIILIKSMLSSKHKDLLFSLIIKTFDIVFFCR